MSKKYFICTKIWSFHPNVTGFFFFLYSFRYSNMPLALLNFRCPNVLIFGPKDLGGLKIAPSPNIYTNYSRQFIKTI